MPATGISIDTSIAINITILAALVSIFFSIVYSILTDYGRRNSEIKHLERQFKKLNNIHDLYVDHKLRVYLEDEFDLYFHDPVIPISATNYFRNICIALDYDGEINNIICSVYNNIERINRLQSMSREPYNKLYVENIKNNILKALGQIHSEIQKYDQIPRWKKWNIIGLIFVIVLLIMLIVVVIGFTQLGLFILNLAFQNIN